MEASLFEKILSTNIINFLIVVSTLVWIFKKAHLGNLIERMAEEIRESIEKSSIDTKKALDEYKQTKKATKGTELLQEKIINQAKINAETIKEKIEAKTIAQRDEIKSRLAKTFENQEQNYKNLTIEEVYTVSIELAKEEILKRLNKDVHKKLINSSINELDNIEGSLS